MEGDSISTIVANGPRNDTANTHTEVVGRFAIAIVSLQLRES